MYPRLSAVAFALCLSSLLAAQEKPVGNRELVTTRPPALLVQKSDDAPSSPIRLTKVQTSIVIRGFLAETTTTMTFLNPHSRVVEGELVFPLPDGSTVSGYALDIGGQLIQSVAVEKHQARIAYESELRAGIDPGLVEWTKGNNFRTRVWPILANQTRTIQVKYVTELDISPTETTYLLPLRYPEPVGLFELKVEVVRPEASPVIAKGELSNLRFSRWEDRYVASTRMENVTFQSDLRIAVPTPDLTAASRLLIERGEDGDHYFTFIDFPRKPQVHQQPAATRIALFWDASLSRATADTERELAILERHLKDLQDVTVAVFVIRNRLDSSQSFVISEGDTSLLRKYLKDMVYDGGTNFSALDNWKDAAGIQPDYAYYILASDGLDNLSNSLPSFDRPVYTICATSQADHRMLGHVAQASGGMHFDLNRISSQEVLSRIGRKPYTLSHIQFEDGALADVLPSTGTPVGHRLVISGRLIADEATLTLHYSDKQTETITIRKADAENTGLVTRQWAQMQVDELSIFPEKNRERLLGLGRKFGLVTPATSLLVLERVDQYVRYRVEPPASRPDMRKEYLAWVRDENQHKITSRQDKLTQVLVMWTQRVAWWEREFVYPDDLNIARATRREQDNRIPEEMNTSEGAIAQNRIDSSLAAPGTSVQGSTGPARRLEPFADGPAARGGGGGGGGGGLFGDPEDEGDRIDDSESGPHSLTSRIEIKPWNPDQPYLKALRQADPENAYEVYLQQRKTYFNSPAFYLDCADFFLADQNPGLGLRILTGILDLEIDNPALLRVVAHRLDQANQHTTAAFLFEEIRRLRPEEPQSHRDLALVLTKLDDYQRAVELYEQVIMEPWDGRFPEIEVIALMELNRLLDRFGESRKLTVTLDKRLRKLLDVDLRIVMTWDTDLTDIDLWVVEPSGEKCFYSNNRSTIGGLVSADMTNGYGPEEYLLRRAMAGNYSIKAHYYGSSQQSLSGNTTLQLVLITNFGRPNETRQPITVRLDNPNAVVDVGFIQFGVDND